MSVKQILPHSFSEICRNLDWCRRGLARVIRLDREPGWVLAMDEHRG